MIEQFIQFCNIEQVPEHFCFPTNKFILCAFAVSSLRKHAASTVQSCLSALKAWHFMHNLEWKGKTYLCCVLNGVHNLAPGGSKRSLHPPVSRDMLFQLINNLNLRHPLDAAIAV